ncbi:MAG TPA: cysteine desulfurase [Candidatus Omnitrophota bacterium]|nr:cysteine desulfurase [Candidatus Omnitrophota bacterium]HPS36844.1 cysteine desulfurase [Candidatus Omnitrophota bacterium]
MERSMEAKTFNAEEVRKDFPLLNEQVYGKPLTYLDNAATTQKPQSVIDTITQFYSKENANIHRGIFCLSEQATKRYKSARHKVQEFLHAASDKEILFVRGTTEAINLVVQCYGRAFLKKDDEVLITHMEHHSNIVPWQMLRDERGIKLKVAPINDDGELLLDEFKKLLTDKVKFVSVVHVSNALGTVNPVKEIVRLAHEKGAVVLLDGAQAVAHTPVDVQDLGCDFYAFSGHKLLGPTGIGVLYGRKELLEKMPPYQGGGDMIRTVTFEKTTYNELPYKFEAGTPHIAGVIGLGTAIDYIRSVGIERIESYEQELLKYGTEKLLQIPGLRLIGTARKKSAILSFVLGEAHAHDIGTILDRQGIAIRAGHHCAMPVMQRFNVPATTRASFAFYNTRQEIDRLVAALHEVTEVFK